MPQNLLRASSETFGIPGQVAIGRNHFACVRGTQLREAIGVEEPAFRKFRCETDERLDRCFRASGTMLHHLQGTALVLLRDGAPINDSFVDTGRTEGAPEDRGSFGRVPYPETRQRGVCSYQ